MPTKHTPGPWTIRDDAPHVKLIRCEPEHVTVAVLHDEANPGEESLATLRADARLIAAAPAMLEALRDCVATLGRLHPETMAYKLACEAFAMAEEG